jgi:hypothetical protein
MPPPTDGAKISIVGFVPMLTMAKGNYGKAKILKTESRNSFLFSQFLFSALVSKFLLSTF